MTYKFDLNKDDLKEYTREYNYNPNEKVKLNKLSLEIKDNDERHLSIEDLRRIVLWKLNRIIDIDESLIFKLDKLAKSREQNLENPEIREIIEKLLNSRGVQLPMASTILKFLHSDMFPIIDVRAYRVLFGKKKNLGGNYKGKFEIYLKYIEKIREISKKTGIPFNEIDEGLYQLDKEKNKKIN